MQQDDHSATRGDPCELLKGRKGDRCRRRFAKRQAPPVAGVSTIVLAAKAIDDAAEEQDDKRHPWRKRELLAKRHLASDNQTFSS